MGRYYKKHQKKSYRSSAGSEAARRHIQEAQEFSKEIGGTDSDVKAYFFQLSSEELNLVLAEYGRTYGSDAEGYARSAMSKWRAGTTKMSGMVAKRLFGLLPPRMPESKKYELAENIWLHFGPATNHSFVVGVTANAEDIASLVAEKLDHAVVNYGLPESVVSRFTWLASGDMAIKEKLLNHFRQLQKQLVIDRVSLEIPVLQRQVREHPNTTGLARASLQVHKHTVDVVVDKNLLDEFREGHPKLVVVKSSGGSWLVWVLVVLFLVFVFLKK